MMDNKAYVYIIEQEITGDVLMDLTTDSLKELGINAYGRRYKIMAAIEKLKSQEVNRRNARCSFMCVCVWLN